MQIHCSEKQICEWLADSAYIIHLAGNERAISWVCERAWASCTCA